MLTHRFKMISKKRTVHIKCDSPQKELAELMGLEPTTFAVTGRCSNQLRYNSGFLKLESVLKILPQIRFASHHRKIYPFFRKKNALSPHATESPSPSTTPRRGTSDVRRRTSDVKRDTGLGTRDLGHGTRNLRLETRDTGHGTRDTGLET